MTMFYRGGQTIQFVVLYLDQRKTTAKLFELIGDCVLRVLVDLTFSANLLLPIATFFFALKSVKFPIIWLALGGLFHRDDAPITGRLTGMMCSRFAAS